MQFKRARLLSGIVTLLFLKLVRGFMTDMTKGPLVAKSAS